MSRDDKNYSVFAVFLTAFVTVALAMVIFVAFLAAPLIVLGLFALGIFIAMSMNGKGKSS